MSYRNRKFYRSRNGKLFGICKGLAEWRDLPVSVVRLLVIILACCTAVVPCLIIYALIAVLVPVEPSDHEYCSERKYRHRTMDDIKEEFDNLKRRVNRMESDATHDERDKEQSWDKRFYSKS